jgi:MoaA/NifB/PqqE/SkfB family radical SAM enzyme
MDNLYVEPLKIRDLYYRLSKLDEERFGYVWEPAPPYAGIHCNYYLYHILVTVMGDVWPCIGLEHMRLGNIREGKLKTFWNHPTMDTIRDIKNNIQGVCKSCSKSKNGECYGCPCRRTYLKGPGSTFICKSCWEDNL